MSDDTRCTTCGHNFFDGEHHEFSPPWLYHKYTPPEEPKRDLSFERYGLNQ
jgi:hypothetical protein